MTVLGLTPNPSRCYPRMPLNRQASAFHGPRKPEEQIRFLHLERYCLVLNQLVKLGGRAGCPHNIVVPFFFFFCCNCPGLTGVVLYKDVVHDNIT